MSDRQRRHAQRPLPYAVLILTSAACLIGSVAGVAAMGHARDPGAERTDGAR